MVQRIARTETKSQTKPVSQAQIQTRAESPIELRHIQHPLPIPECVIKYRLQQRTGRDKNSTFRDVTTTTDYWAMRASRLTAMKQYPDRDLRVIKETYITHMVLAKEEILK